MREKFPALVHGAVASSATLDAMPSYTGFDAQLRRTVGPACADALSRAARELDGLLAQPARRAAAKAAFGAEALRDGTRTLTRARARTLAQTRTLAPTRTLTPTLTPTQARA